MNKERTTTAHPEQPSDENSLENFLNLYCQSGSLYELRYGTRKQYKKAYKVFLTYAKALGKNQIGDIPDIKDSYSSTVTVSMSNLVASAINRALRWGVKEGYVNGIILKGTRREKVTRIFPKEQNPPSSLSQDELKQLMGIASIRERALITTIMVARADSDTIRALRSDSYKVDKNKNLFLSVNGKNHRVDPQFRDFIFDYYLELGTPGPLFPSPTIKGESITRQAMDLRFKKYRDQLNLPELNYGLLTKTGNQLFGRLKNPHLPHTPEP